MACAGLLFKQDMFVGILREVRHKKVLSDGNLGMRSGGGGAVELWMPYFSWNMNRCWFRIVKSRSIILGGWVIAELGCQVGFDGWPFGIENAVEDRITYETVWQDHVLA